MECQSKVAMEEFVERAQKEWGERNFMITLRKITLDNRRELFRLEVTFGSNIYGFLQ